jgi:cytochrome c oxidase assembly protein subunit 15
MSEGLGPLAASPWPRRFAGAAALVLVPLFLFGGSVTTLGAGMAVQGWWNAEGHFLPFFPLEKWFRDLGTFVEHSHRQFGMLIGLLMLAAIVTTFRWDRRPSARWLVSLAFGAICVQGWIGGSRVLENSPGLAFLHGSFGQIVFACLAAVWVHQSPAWREPGSGDRSAAAPSPRLAWLAVVLVWIQSTLGGWYRHTLRTGMSGDAAGRLGMHLIGAFCVLGLVLVLAAALQRAAQADPHAPWGRQRAKLLALVAIQFALGFLAFGLEGVGPVGFAEWLTATAHVLVGAALLAQCVTVAMFSRRATGSLARATACVESPDSTNWEAAR